MREVLNKVRPKPEPDPKSQARFTILRHNSVSFEAIEF